MKLTKADAVAQILDELSRAEDLFSPFNSSHEGLATIWEEFEELKDEVFSKQNTPDRDYRMRREATQVAAMAMRFMLDIDSEEI